jgi:hypothetical protein
MDENKSTKILIAISAVMTALAGTIHLWLAPIHWFHSPAHGIFFLVVGVAQVLWSIFVWREPSFRLYVVGAVMSGWLIVLYGITRWLPAPSHHGPEAMGWIDLTCKACEALGMIILLILVFQGLVLTSGRSAARRTIGRIVVFSFIAGFVTYSLARAAEPIFPDWVPPTEVQHAHDEDVPHDHDE